MSETPVELEALITACVISNGCMGLT